MAIAEAPQIESPDARRIHNLFESPRAMEINVVIKKVAINILNKMIHLVKSSPSQRFNWLP